MTQTLAGQSAADLIRLRLSTPILLSSPDPRWPIARILAGGDNITLSDEGASGNLTIHASSAGFVVYVKP